MDLLERITRFLTEHKLILTTAESCTAGLIVSELARVPGSGQSIVCGLAVYSPEAKQRYLGVRAETIERHGLTSEPVSREMALGALEGNHADVAVANTGVAGPGDADDGTPEGTLCFAWAYRHDGAVYVFCETRRFDGDRNEVRLHGAHYALERIPHYHQRVTSGDARPVDAPETRPGDQ
jgi:PncC family amidohydrolase